MRVSHETIYRSLFIQARGVLKEQLLAHCARGEMRRARTAAPRARVKDKFCGAVSIRERPAEAEDRAVPGHWEGDLIMRLEEHADRHPGGAALALLLLVKIPSRQSADVVKHLPADRLPAGRITPLLDLGSGHRDGRTQAASPSPPTCRCTSAIRTPLAARLNENTNGLLRQYFPKGTDLSCILKPS